MPSDHAAHRFWSSSGWSLWRQACLRSAGFPADAVLELADADSAGAAEVVLAQETAFETERSAAVAACQARLNQAGGKDKNLWRRVLKRLYSRALPDEIGETEPLVKGVRGAHAALTGAQGVLTAKLAAAERRALSLTRERVREPHFREALLWQNRGAVHRVEAALQGDANDSSARKQARLIASYLQRYAVKNDTIGFFGPVGWAALVDHGPPLEIKPGRTLLDKRTVYFEYWAVDELAQRFGAELLPWLAPRLLPSVRWDGSALWVPMDRRIELPVSAARLVAACDGNRSANAIAAELVGDATFESEDEAFQLLEELRDRRILSWGIDIATQGPFPERRLRRALLAVDAEPARQALRQLDDLEARRQQVARAAGDPAALDSALAALDETFTSITDTAAQRRPGEIYAGRIVVYEDCRRDLEVRFGSAFNQALAEPLSLLLQSARWSSFTIAEGYREQLRRSYNQLRSELGTAQIDFLRFRAAAMELFPAANRGEPPEMIARTAASLRSRWVEILGATPEQRRIQHTTEALRAQVGAAFAAPHPGWPEARFQQPDVMVAARGPEAFAAGEFEIVLGELHHSMASVLFATYLKEHDAPEALLHARRLDRPGPAVAPVEPKESAVPRSDYSPFGAGDFHVELGITRSWLPREQVLAAAELVVEEKGGELIISTRDGQHAFDVIAFFEQQLIAAVNLIGFSPLPTWHHAPRITIDRLVVSRERWRPAVEELAFVHSGDTAQRFVGMRRWAKSAGVPRWFFVKIPEEPKPCFVDLDSPTYVDMFAHLVRKASAVTISEMLPSPEETWIIDAEGRRYCAELRMVAVDPEPFPLSGKRD